MFFFKKHLIVEAVIVGGLCLVLGGILISRQFIKASPLEAVVMLHKQEMKRFDLNALDETGETYYLDVGETEKMEIHAKHQSIAIKHSPCLGQECVNQGYISHGYEVIVCAPYGVYIYLKNISSNMVVVG